MKPSDRVPTETELIQRCLAGDTEAYAVIVDRYQRAVYATAYYYVRRVHAAEDVAQEAFFAAYRTLPNLRDHNRFAPWLKQITCRTAANWLRKHGKRLQNETPLPHRRTISIEDARPGPRGSMEREECFERVQNAIDSLPERYRLPVVLRYLQELSYDEISAFTGETRDEIGGILQRASRQLRDLLTELRDNGETRWRRARK